MVNNSSRFQNNPGEGLKSADQHSLLAALITLRESNSASAEQLKDVCRLLMTDDIAVKAEAIATLGVVGTANEIRDLRELTTGTENYFTPLAIQSLLLLGDFEFAELQIATLSQSPDPILRGTSQRLRKSMKKLRRRIMPTALEDATHMPGFKGIVWGTRTNSQWKGAIAGPGDLTKVDLQVNAPPSSERLGELQVRSLSLLSRTVENRVWDDVFRKINDNNFRSSIIQRSEIEGYQLDQVVIPSDCKGLDVAVAFRLRALNEGDEDIELFWVNDCFVAFFDDLIADDLKWYRDIIPLLPT